MSRIISFEGIGGGPIADLAEDHPLATADGTDLPDDVDASRVRAVIVRNRTRVDERFLARLPSLQVVARAGVGLDNIDLAAARRRGITVVSPRGANAQSVAELTLALALTVARRLLPLDDSTRHGGWDRRPGLELAGRTWGLLGAGATGIASGRLARAIGMEVVAHDPFADPEVLRGHGIDLLPLREMVTRADVLSAHLPATEGTKGVVDRQLLSLLPEGAILVNTGRGEVVDEDALTEALASGRLTGAGLDVRAVEPPAVGALERLDNVVLTPHVAGITGESQHRILSALARDITAVLAGAPARHAVEQPAR